jgi:hypothetical protein
VKRAPRWLRKVAAVILPWPGRDERAVAITSAQMERKRSQEAARKASDLEKQIRKMTHDNHFAAMIAQQILKGMR